MKNAENKTVNLNRLIMCYGLSEDQLDVLKSNLPTSGCEVIGTDCFTDIIVSPEMVVITVWDEMDDNDKGAFEGFFSDIAPFLETVIVIGDPDVNSDLRKRILIYESFELLSGDLEYTLLGAYKKTRKSERFSATLANALTILKAIKSKPYVTTQQLADLLEISKRSVQRYIETLRVSGEWIEYDVAHKGWTVMPEWDPYDDISINKKVEELNKI